MTIDEYAHVCLFFYNGHIESWKSKELKSYLHFGVIIFISLFIKSVKWAKYWSYKMESGAKTVGGKQQYHQPEIALCFWMVVRQKHNGFYRLCSWQIQVTTRTLLKNVKVSQIFDCYFKARLHLLTTIYTIN